MKLIITVIKTKVERKGPSVNNDLKSSNVSAGIWFALNVNSLPGCCQVICPSSDIGFVLHDSLTYLIF